MNAHERQCATIVQYNGPDDIPTSVQEQLAHLRHDVHNVVVLYYGGTIGMHENERGELVPTDNAEELLKPLIVKGLDKRVNVIWFPVYPKAIDSTNGRWVHWVSIGNAIRYLYDMVDGFVVCGGTDTMAHMMAAMQFMFPNIGKPVIGCGAQLPMFRLGDDATRNLYFALAVAASDVSGAHLAFADILRHGLHIFKVKDRGFAAFDCPQRFIMGDFDGEPNVYPSAPRRNPFVTKERLEFHPEFREGVKVVKVSPATSCEAILHDAKDPSALALLLITYGAGGVRDEPLYEGELTHIDAMTTLRQRGFPVVLGSPMMDGVVDCPYAPGAKAVSSEAGGISGGDTCGVTLEVKIMRCLALAWSEERGALDYEKFRAEMLRNHVGELTR